MMYRPASRRRFAVALLAALTIEGSAILIAGIHKTESVAGSMQPSYSSVEIAIVPNEIPPQTQLQPAEPQPVESDSPPLAQNDYPQEPALSPTRQLERTRSRVVKPSVAASALVGIRMANALFVSAPPPVYSYEMRRSRAIGNVRARLGVNSSTGEIMNVILVQASGNPLLDSASVAALRRWRAKPFGPSSIVVPITYTMTGVR